MSSLTPETIRKLSTEGWKCDDYKNLCPIKEHKGKVNRLVYDPDEDLAEIEFLGNSLVMHIGEIYSKIDKESDKKNLIPPGKFIFFLTKEAVNVPMDIDGILFMNPNYSNMGLLFFTLGHVDPGFHGYLTGAILNMTSKPILVDRHAGCLFLIFYKLETATEPIKKFHRYPQLSLSEAKQNQGFSLDPGFAFTKEDFVPKEDLYALTKGYYIERSEFWTIIIAMLTIFLLFITFVTLLLNN
jgi:deoxycytidine triphosphate deaminase